MSETPTPEQLIEQGLRDSETHWLPPIIRAEDLYTFSVTVATKGIIAAFKTLPHATRPVKPDGPHDGCQFWHGGKDCTLRKTAHRAATALWKAPNRTLTEFEFEKAAESETARGTAYHISKSFRKAGIEML